MKRDELERGCECKQRKKELAREFLFALPPGRTQSDRQREEQQAEGKKERDSSRGRKKELCKNLNEKKRAEELDRCDR